MSVQHHGFQGEPMDEEMKKLFQRFEDQKSGKAKRTYSDGRKAADDEGDLAFKIGPDEKGEFIKIEFGKPVEWIGLPPENAIALAQMLIKHARAISKDPITIQLH